MNMYAEDWKFWMNYAFGGKFVYYVYHVYNLRKRYEMLLHYMVMILVNDEHENVGLGLKIWSRNEADVLCRQES